MHVGFLCLVGALALVRQPRRKSAGGRERWLLWLIGAAGFLAGLYQWAVLFRSGAALGRSADAGHHRRRDRARRPCSCWCGASWGRRCRSWRASSWPIACSATTCRRRSIIAAMTSAQVVEHMVFGTEGIYGTPTLVSATYIFLFILFGSFMEQAGIIRFFNEISMAAFGRARGGPGKVCVASSRADGHGLGLRRRQRGRLRPVHHSADEALRLHARHSPAGSRRPPRWAARSCRR